MLFDCNFVAMNFQSALINWYNQNKRDLPWRNTTDPYIIWLSEVILQQTRVEQGLPYFNRFLEHFPTVSDFAAATEEEVLKLWQGLGYYSRGRNMLFTAKLVVNDHHGIFPSSYEHLIKLKGIGGYTAAAISSFSSDENRAVVDGNVFRVLARYFGIDEPINSTSGKKTFEKLANDLVKSQSAALYNQAIMEFGALHCKPKNPLCETCPLNIDCVALKTNQVSVLPIKLKLVKVKERFFNYFILLNEEKIWIKKRLDKDVWQNMYDFPLIETSATPAKDDTFFLDTLKKMFGNDVTITFQSSVKHKLTHQTIFVQFFALANYIINFNKDDGLIQVSIDDFEKLPHPKVISDFFQNSIKTTNQI